MHRRAHIVATLATVALAALLVGCAGGASTSGSPRVETSALPTETSTDATASVVETPTPSSTTASPAADLAHLRVNFHRA